MILHQGFRFALIAGFGVLAPRGAAAPITVHSTSGYDVHIDVVAIQLVPHSSTCPWGYNYDVKLSYQISFTGSNQPSSLWTLQGTVGCGSNSLFFSLPKAPASGTVTTVSNPWRNQSDCNTATLASLGCNTLNVVISGPGISFRTLSMPLGTLPIELVAFQAQAQAGGVQLSWTTASERDNAFFTVERSTDAMDFTPLLQLPGAGNSMNLLHYSATDPTPLPGIAYYRLRQTDLNGTSTLSSVVPVVNTMDLNQPLMAWPNPANTPQVELPQRVSNRAVEIRSLTGSLVRISHLEGNKLPCHGLAAGTYLLRITDPATGFSEQCRLVRY